MFSRSSGLVFVHVQKTGGMSVTRLLHELLPDLASVRLPGGRHQPLEDALIAYPELRDYFAFGFVRDPWARLHSWYRMIERRGLAAEEGHGRAGKLVKRVDLWRHVLEHRWTFEDFVLTGLQERPELRTPQTSYLVGPTKEADFIGRTEQFETDMREALKRAGVNWDGGLPRRNVSPDKVDHRTQYTAEMRDRVAEVFQPDIERFGYTF